MNSAQTLDLALRQHQAGNLPEAEQLYRQILQAEPHHADALHLLGVIAHQVGRHDLAVEYIRASLRERPNLAAAHSHLGIVFQALGQLDEAVASYERALSFKPDYAEAQYNLGNVRKDQGKLEEAIVSYRKALHLKPDFAAAHNNLGSVLQNQGKLAEAIASYQQALRLRPDFAEAHHNLGAVWLEQNKLSEAAAGFQQALRLKPNFAEAHYNLGRVLTMQGKLDEAVAAYERALSFRPEHVETLTNLGGILMMQEKLDEAAALCERALRLKPDCAETLCTLGGVLMMQEKLPEAVARCEHALRLKPDYAEAHSNLGSALADLGKLDEAEANIRKALRLKPDLAETLNNLGSVLQIQGKLDEAAASFERALQLNPDNGNYHVNYAMLLLVQGNFEKGWSEFEWRWRRPSQRPRPFPQPLWQGEPLSGRTILLHAEQGFGDTLQMIRYIALVRAQGAGRVLLECPVPLVPLLTLSCDPDPQSGLGADQVVPHGKPLPSFDLHAPLLSLPRLFETFSVERIPANGPYLRCDPELVQHWRTRLESLSMEQGSSLPKLRVGIAWQGNPKYPSDRSRSIPLIQFERLARMDGVQLFSLQKGFGSQQLTEMQGRFPIIDLSANLDETSGAFMDTAAVMKCLDLIITCDTAIGHLAGALGVAFWEALPFVPDWRWLLGREDSPWYPTVRLFRQERPGEWETVFQRMAAQLEIQLKSVNLPVKPWGELANIQESSNTKTVSQLLEQSLQYHQAGNLHQAETLYQQILQIDPQNADALHRIGLVAHQVGRSDLAVQYIQQALGFRSIFPEAHHNLGSILQSQGKLVEAIASYQQAVRLKPDYAQAHINLGLALKAQGRLAEAVASYQQALRSNPENAEAYSNLGVALQEQGNFAEAIASYRQAVRLKPDLVEVYNNLGNVRKNQGMPDEAIEQYQEALRLKPDYALAHNNLGNALKDQGKLEEAIVSYQQALRLKPDCAEVYNNLGLVLQLQGKLTEAIASLHQALRLKPDCAEAYTNLGNTFQEQGKSDEAISNLRQAVHLNPDSADAHNNLGMWLLIHGDFERGWPEYEWRWRCKELSPMLGRFSQPRWDGSDLTGKTILLFAEQGIGDIVQFIRYAALIKKRGGTVVFECPDRFMRMLGRLPGVDRIVPRGSPLPAFDVQLPLMSAPLVLGTTLATIPADVPYLAVEPDLLEHWAEELSTKLFRVGITWQGSPKYKRDRVRSFPLTCFEPLAGIDGVQLYSLQKGPGSEQLAQLGGRFSVIDLGPRLDLAGAAFVDTAAAMKNLDLVISPDSATAHLAGALGVPTWVALPLVPHWPWLLEREDSPWYPTVRLFRQKTWGDWHGVFERMAEALNRITPPKESKARSGL